MHTKINKTVENIDITTHTGLIEVLNNLMDRKDELESEIEGIRENIDNASKMANLVSNINGWYKQPLINIVNLTSFAVGGTLVELSCSEEVVNFLGHIKALMYYSDSYDNVYAAIVAIMEAQ